MQRKQGYADREQSGVIRFFFLCVQPHFDQFPYIGVFKFCMEKTSNALVSATKVNSIQRVVVARVTNCDAKFSGSTHYICQLKSRAVARMRLTRRSPPLILVACHKKLICIPSDEISK